MKSDERQLLAAVAQGEWPRDAGVRLCIHPKRVIRLCEKWTGKGWYDYGVSVDLGWLTDEGREAIRRIEEDGAPGRG